jgi:CBS domain-containing protein
LNLRVIKTGIESGILAGLVFIAGQMAAGLILRRPVDLPLRMPASMLFGMGVMVPGLTSRIWPFAGLLIHAGISAVWGALFVWILYGSGQRGRSRSVTAAYGAAYGFLLWVADYLVIGPAFFPQFVLLNQFWDGFVCHTFIFGTLLGYLVSAPGASSSITMEGQMAARRKRSLKVEEIMTRGAETIGSSASVKDAASVMKRLDIGAIPVQDDGSLKGMLTDRDIALRLVAEGRDPAATHVSDIMTSETVTCSPQDDIRDVEKTMEMNRIRRVIITDSGNKAIGIVSIGDIALHLGKQEGGEVLQKVSEPVHSQAR